MSAVTTALASLLIFGLVILIHETGHFIAAKRSGIKVNEFSLGMGPALFKKQRGETTYSLRALPIGGFVSMEGEDPETGERSRDPRSYPMAPVWKRLLVISAGALMNLALGFLVLVALTTTEKAITSRTIASFAPDAATQRTGLQVNDTILAVNGRKCFIAEDIIYEFARTQNGTADFTVRRNGAVVEVPNVQFSTKTLPNGTKDLNIDFTVYPIQKTVFSVLGEALRWTASVARLVFLSLTDLITGRAPVNSLSGPVGIVSVIGQVTSQGLRPLLFVLAIITINIGIFNLLPLPALDGGKLFLLLIEAIVSKPIPAKFESIINIAGFVALLTLMLFATYNDILRLFTPK